ncbi:MAG: HPr family phosphocarrier protein [Vallitalea sp.]|jgi:phosphotransferase system HPr (HPr) family protein|nr:HPr family phosphocarrier protein [Vallitalea sp.]
MISKEVIFTYDFHAISTAYFVNEASKIQSSITIVIGNKKVNAKTILGVMSLEIIKGDKAHIIVDGIDEVEGMDKIKYLVNTPPSN